MIAYRATRQISLGQIRQTLQPGDVVGFDGRTTHIEGKDHCVPTMDAIIKEGWLVPVDAAITTPTTSLTVAPPQLPALAPLEAPPELNVRGERVPYAHADTAKAAVGKRPKASQQHVWGSGSSVSPDWLNDTGGKTCRICGVTELTPGSLIRTDRQRGDGSQQIHYRDAHGNVITSFEELSCPTYLGDPGSAAAVAKDQVRKVRGRVDDVEGHLETVDDRLAQLEADNDFFRQRILEQPVLDATMVAEALLIIASKSGHAPRLAERVHLLLTGGIMEDVLRPVLDAELVKVVKSADDP